MQFDKINFVEDEKYYQPEIRYGQYNDVIIVSWLNYETGITSQFSFKHKTNKVLHNWLLLTLKYDRPNALEMFNLPDTITTDELINEIVINCTDWGKIFTYENLVQFIKYVRGL